MKPHCTILAFAITSVLLSGCTSLVRIGPKADIKAYSGDGKIGLLSRHYGPGMETHGYSVEFPAFTPTESHQKEYRLSGLPLWEQTAHVEIVTFLPTTPMNASQAAKLAPSLPPNHTLSCSVLDKKTGRVVTQHRAQLSELERSRTLRCMQMPFVKHILSVDLGELSSTTDLVLQFIYDNGGQPTEQEMFLILIVDAPTA